jgi:DNA polymerase III epsilon subunit-like protein
MKIVFFDMEFANGKIPGSVYSLGYVQTNERFKLTQPQTDLLINPDCEWNAYVRSHILAYPMKTVKQASLFPAYYARIKKLLTKADLVVGFAVKNDTTALYKACERYGLKPISFTCLDMERFCKALKDHPQAHGLNGYVRAYCGIDPDNQHRSDGDAYATMLLLKAICEKHKLSPKKLKKEYGAHFIDSAQEPKEDEGKKKRKSRGKRVFYRKRAKKQENNFKKSIDKTDDV